MSKTIGNLSKIVKDNKDTFFVVNKEAGGLYELKQDGSRVTIKAFTVKNARHQAKQMFGYGFDVINIKAA